MSQRARLLQVAEQSEVASLNASALAAPRTVSAGQVRRFSRCRASSSVAHSKFLLFDGSSSTWVCPLWSWYRFFGGFEGESTETPALGGGGRSKNHPTNYWVLQNPSLVSTCVCFHFKASQRAPPPQKKTKKKATHTATGAFGTYTRAELRRKELAAKVHLPHSVKETVRGDDHTSHWGTCLPLLRLAESQSTGR